MELDVYDMLTFFDREDPVKINSPTTLFESKNLKKIISYKGEIARKFKER